MKRYISLSLFSLIIFACGNTKNIAQSKAMTSTDSLIQHINNSPGDTDIINPKLKELQQENDLVISFGTLNYAWARRGSFYVLAEQNKQWKVYRYDSKLPPSAEDAVMSISPSEVSAAEAEKVTELYAKAGLWKTGGDNGENFCSDKKNCNITDAETWTISVATKNNIRTITYYAPEFFEDCCPGNQYRKAFITIAKAMMKLSPETSNGADR